LLSVLGQVVVVIILIVFITNYCYHCNYFSAYTQQHRIDSPVTCRKRLTLENEKIERQLEKLKKRQNRLKSALHSGQSGGFNLFPTSSLSGPFDMSLAKDLERQEVTPEIDQPQKHIGQVEEVSE